MGMNTSIAGVGMYVTLITLALGLFGITPDQGSVQQVVMSLATLVGFVLWVFGQLRRKDLTFGLFRKA